MGENVVGVIVSGKRRRRRKATREALMKDLGVMIQEGSTFIVYSDWRAGKNCSDVKVRRAPASRLGRARENA
jgi:hypothetical protein